MQPQVILLNGPSSSGKSTLSRALQELIRKNRSEKYEVVSIDDFMKSDPMETIYEDDVYEISGDMCRRVLGALQAGSGVIVDHVITSERIFRQLPEYLYPKEGYDLAVDSSAGSPSENALLIYEKFFRAPRSCEKTAE